MKQTDKLYRLKDNIINNLGDYADAQLSPAVMEVIRNASSAAKNLCKIIEACEEEEGGYSERGYSMDGYRGGRSYDDGRSYADGNSYARGRRRAPRDSMGRYSGYSRHSGREAAEDLRAMAKEAPDEESRRELERVADMMEQR